MRGLLLAWLLCAAANAELAAAEEAYRTGRYDLVLPSLERALAHPLSDAQRRRAYELKGIAAAAFDDTGTAIDAFRHLLGVDPTYQPGDEASPKLRGLFEEAARQGPIGAPKRPPESDRPLKPSPEKVPDLWTRTAPPVPEKPSLLTRPWLWMVVGAVTAAAAGGTYLIATEPPHANLPARHLN